MTASLSLSLALSGFESRRRTGLFSSSGPALGSLTLPANG